MPLGLFCSMGFLVCPLCYLYLPEVTFSTEALHRPKKKKNAKWWRCSNLWAYGLANCKNVTVRLECSWGAKPRRILLLFVCNDWGNNLSHYKKEISPNGFLWKMIRTKRQILTKMELLGATKWQIGCRRVSCMAPACGKFPVTYPIPSNSHFPSSAAKSKSLETPQDGWSGRGKEDPGGCV